MAELMTALALMLAIEGLAFAAFPAAMRRAMAEVTQMPDGILRIVGIIGALLGIVLVWASRGFPALKLL